MPQVPQRNGLCDSHAASDCPAYATNHLRLLQMPSDPMLHAFITDGRCLCCCLRSRSEAHSGNCTRLVNDRTTQQGNSGKISASGLPALGHQRTFCDAEAISTLPPKAKIPSAERNVRQVPKSARFIHARSMIPGPDQSSARQQSPLS